MESTTEPGIDLFADELPSMDEIKKLSEYVHSGERNMISFGEQVESHMSDSGQKASLSVGIGLFMLGRNGEAVARARRVQLPGDLRGDRSLDHGRRWWCGRLRRGSDLDGRCRGRWRLRSSRGHRFRLRLGSR